MAAPKKIDQFKLSGRFISVWLRASHAAYKILPSTYDVEKPEDHVYDLEAQQNISFRMREVNGALSPLFEQDRLPDSQKIFDRLLDDILPRIGDDWYSVAVYHGYKIACQKWPKEQAFMEKESAVPGSREMAIRRNQALYEAIMEQSSQTKYFSQEM